MTLRTERLETANGLVGSSMQYIARGCAKVICRYHISNGLDPVSLNVSTLNDIGVGVFQPNLINAMDNTSYSVALSSYMASASQFSNHGPLLQSDADDPASVLQIKTAHGNFGTASETEPVYINVMAFGDLT